MIIISIQLNLDIKVTESLNTILLLFVFIAAL
ncbi:hypothetical protein G3A_02055 [Bacillus sp. 17376]|nr:hypothetical protein G3A_02055 [Bacillus sp. 17376]